MHWTIRGPEGHVLPCGLVPDAGAWCAVDGDTRYDATIPSFDADAPILSILVHLSQYGVFGSDGIADALTWVDEDVGRGEEVPSCLPCDAGGAEPVRPWSERRLWARACAESGLL